MRNPQFGMVRSFAKWFRPALYIMFLSLFFFACNRADQVEQSELYGQWDISKAERNGKETSYLRGGYFIIGTDGYMTINITGTAEKGKYTMENNKLFMEGDKVFEIEALRNDSLRIKYDSETSNRFLFYMQKKTDDVQ